MTKRYGAHLALAVLFAAACGSSEEDIDLGPDAAETDTPEACDPIEQSGCEAGEKCANRIESTDPFVSAADCVPDGTAAAGEDCSLVGDPAAGEGYDDCEAGLTCSNGRCTPICDADVAGFCDDVDGVCVAVSSFFDDHIGLCADACHPVEQDCDFAFDDDDGDNGNGDNGNGDGNGDNGNGDNGNGDGNGDNGNGDNGNGDGDNGDGDNGNGEEDEESVGACYFHPTYNDGVCLRVAGDATDLVQGDECHGTGSGPGFLNGCAAGHGCWLPLSQDLWTCTFFCEPTGNFDGAPCGAEGGPGADGYECRYLNGWLGNETAQVPETMGVCLPTDLQGLTPCANDPSGPGCSHLFSPSSQAKPRAHWPSADGALQSLER